jgi:hypothetical protein
MPDNDAEVPARLTKAFPFSSQVLLGCHVAEHSEQNSFWQLGHLTSTGKQFNKINKYLEVHSSNHERIINERFN